MLFHENFHANLPVLMIYCFDFCQQNRFGCGYHMIKKSSSGEISPAIIKLAKKEILIPITNCINKCISIKSFPDELKVADVIPVFKKEDPNNKASYRPISLLPIISKIFERVLFEQIEKFSEKILSPKLRGFRKGHPTQHALTSAVKLAKNFRQVWCYSNSSDGPKQGIRLSST